MNKINTSIASANVISGLKHIQWNERGVITYFIRLNTNAEKLCFDITFVFFSFNFFRLKVLNQ